ncbi:MAG: DNA cytosine methyltransferase, partial [Salinibacterium sp.]
MTSAREFKVLHLFCGLGGGALGFQRARARAHGLEGRFRTIAGIDIDAEACADFRRLTGARAVQADLGMMPPGSLLDACRDEAPDVVFCSPPCKGFSRLLSAKRAAEEKYQKLNRLVFQGLWLTLETFRYTPPALIILENVPAIVQRGADLLLKLRGLLAGYGYRIHESTHDCGELGGLAQHRTRFLLVARHEAQVPTFLYRPTAQRVRAIGEVLEQLPLPDDPAGGPLHRLPRIHWRTWVRLALIPAGKDWRALGTVQDGERYNNVLRVVPWDAPSVAVTGGGTPTAGGVCVADPRLGCEPRAGAYGVASWAEPAGTITGSVDVHQGTVAAVADPRFAQEYRRGTYGVLGWDNPSGTVTGEAAPSTGSFSVADPRFSNLYRVEDWNEPAHAVIGARRPAGGALSVADPRFDCSPHAHRNRFRVERWDAPAGTVTAASRPGSGGPCVADPRITGKGSRPDLYGVIQWDQPAKTISGHPSVSGSNCPAAVADPRIP